MLATLQAMLGSASWSDPFTLGEVWSANPDLLGLHLPSSSYPEAVHVTIGAISNDPAIPLQVVMH